jgi:hypothetical protein
MDGGDPQLPHTWRIPSWQPAALILLATVLIAYDIYGSPSLGALLMTAVIAAAGLVGALVAVRYLLVADDDGIWVRSLFAQQLVEWRDIADIEVTHVRGTTSTVRITCADRRFIDVPPTLLQPTLPTGARRAHAAVGAVARELIDLAQQHDPRTP